MSMSCYSHLHNEKCVRIQMLSSLDTHSVYWRDSFDGSVPDLIHCVWKSVQSLPSIKEPCPDSAGVSSPHHTKFHSIIWRLFSSDCLFSERSEQAICCPVWWEGISNPKLVSSHNLTFPKSNTSFFRLHSAPRSQARLLAASLHMEPGPFTWHTRGLEKVFYFPASPLLFAFLTRLYSQVGICQLKWNLSLIRTINQSITTKKDILVKFSHNFMIPIHTR